MSKALFLLAFFPSVLNCLGQGQVVFANKVGTTVDAPVFLNFPSPGGGPGPDYSAQLVLVNENNSITPLVPISTFRTDGIGAASIADRYWESKLVDVPGVQPGANTTFFVRAWLTAAGSYETAQLLDHAQSNPFTITVGGGTLPPSNLTTLTSFVFPLPEPSTITLGIIGSVALVLYSRRRRDEVMLADDEPKRNKIAAKL